MIALAAFQKRLDRWNRADSLPEDLAGHMEKHELEKREPLRLDGLAWMVGIGMGGGYLCLLAGPQLPALGDVVNAFGWTVILGSMLGLVLSFTPVARLERQGASHLGNFFLYVLIATIGAQADLRAITEVPLFMMVGVVWILVHAAVLFAACWNALAWGRWVGWFQPRQTTPCHLFMTRSGPDSSNRSE